MIISIRETRWFWKKFSGAENFCAQTLSHKHSHWCCWPAHSVHHKKTHTYTHKMVWLFPHWALSRLPKGKHVAQDRSNNNHFGPHTLFCAYNSLASTNTHRKKSLAPNRKHNLAPSNGTPEAIFKASVPNGSLNGEHLQRLSSPPLAPSI